MQIRQLTSQLHVNAESTQDAIDSKPKRNSGPKQDAFKGFAFYTAYTLLLAANNYTQLFLFSQTQGVSTFQLTFIRGVICAFLVVFMLLVQGESLKKRLLDPLDRSNVKPLVLRAF